MEDLQVEDFNDPIEHKAEQTADGIKTPENQENDEECKKNGFTHGGFI